MSGGLEETIKGHRTRVAALELPPNIPDPEFERYFLDILNIQPIERDRDFILFQAYCSYHGFVAEAANATDLFSKIDHHMATVRWPHAIRYWVEYN